MNKKELFYLADLSDEEIEELLSSDDPVYSHINGKSIRVTKEMIEDELPFVRAATAFIKQQLVLYSIAEF